MEATTSPQAQPIGLGVAAAASIGAGVIHAGAIGVHAEHIGLSRLFIVAAIFQIGWGALALAHPRRWVGLVGAVGNLAIVGGWLVTRVADIGWISGLEVHEAPAFADTVCAALGIVAGGGALLAWLLGDRPVHVPTLALSTLAIAALAVPAVAAASTHTHEEGAAHDHGTAVDATGATGVAAVAGDGHTHAAEEVVVAPPAASAATPDATAAPDTTVAADHTHEVAAAVAPVPYDPLLPIDLGGVPGVTLEQQARAENLVAITVLRLPQFADTATAEANGFRSIGDGATGHEHYINWSYVNDDKILDPDHPESLVYAVDGSGTKQLVSAMFMLPDEYTLDNTPDIGGTLTQWHVHDNLCFAPDPNDALKVRVVGITIGPDQICTAGERSEKPNPMIHVWITANPCGPFAALEGIAAGQVKAGETHLCDAAHGGH